MVETHLYEVVVVALGLGKEERVVDPIVVGARAVHEMMRRHRRRVPAT